MRSASSWLTHVTMIVTTYAIIIEAELQMQNSTFTSQVSGSMVSNSNTKASSPSAPSTISLREKCTLFTKNCCVQAQGSPSSEPIPLLVLICWRSLKAETISTHLTHMHHPHHHPRH